MRRTIGFITILLIALFLVSPVNISAYAVDDDPDKQAQNFEVSNNEIIKFDFNDENYDPEEDGWCVIGGKWEVEDGCLKQTRDFTGWNEKQLNYTKKTFGDFTAKMRFKVREVTGASQCWFAFAMRRKQYNHQHEESGYIVCTEGPKCEVPGKSYFVDWTKSLAYEEYADYVDVSDFVELVVVAKGGTYTFYYNDAIKTGDYNFRINDTSWTEPGFIGLAAGNALIEVDYLYLYTGDKQEGIIEGNGSSNGAIIDRSIDEKVSEKKDTLLLIIMIVAAVSLIGGVCSLFVGGKKDEK